MVDETRLTATVCGRVQGVGFRDFVRRQAEPLGLCGRVSNLADGRVEVIAEGDRAATEQLVDALRGGRTPGWVSDVDARWSAPEGGLGSGFRAG